MSLSVIIPVYNESRNLEKTVNNLIKLKKRIKKLNLIFIDDFSTDNTYDLVKKLSKKNSFIKIFKNKKKGLGSAIEKGFKKSRFKYVAIFMADSSDSIDDLIKYYKIISSKKYDAVLGSRFIKDSKIKNYPFFKFLLNRIFNNFVKLIFLSDYNDFTNAFKIYKRNVLKNLLPIVSENFNVFLEIPLKIITRKYTYKIIPINWQNRKVGKSNFKIKELSSMYIFTLIYCLIEKILLNKKK
ncbi:glycosyltransferase family 2 protein [Candidatus Pelagibacter sp.]|nr:glycosyltransferase family 2 protein [Candidatus Pelagibacter sp.]